MKYASNYFSFVRRLLAPLSCITPTPLAKLVFAHARAFPHLFFFSSRVAVSPGLDIPSRLYPTT